MRFIKELRYLGNMWFRIVRIADISLTIAVSVVSNAVNSWTLLSQQSTESPANFSCSCSHQGQPVRVIQSSVVSDL